VIDLFSVPKLLPLAFMSMTTLVKFMPSQANASIAQTPIRAELYLCQKLLPFMAKLLLITVFCSTLLCSTSDQVLTQNNLPNTQISVPTPNPTELGDVHWLRNLDAGRQRAQAESKPMLILFQEVPGCSNCTRYGSVTLTHPLIVEAIETYFVPVCIYNNEKGADAAALKRYNEPSWNNPVVRIVNAQDQDLTERMANFRSQSQIVQGMVAALKKSEQPAPIWLQNLADELLAHESGLETATYAMHCFWVGESNLAQQPGVFATKAGWQDGKEVVQVQYNPKITNPKQIGAQSSVDQCDHHDGFKLDREPKYYLSQTDWRFVPMTAAQSSRANALVGQQQDVASILSPRQFALAQKLTALQKSGKKLQSQIEAPDFTKAWKETVAKL
jgi:Thioredoxin-like